MRVYLTVDTEVWPRRAGWPHRPLDIGDACERQLQAYFWGGDREPRQGLPFMLQTLAERKLRATFFIDPLFSLALGREQLRAVVQAVEHAGQEVGLHLHPEWLTDLRATGLPQFKGPLLHMYPLQEQVQLLETGVRLLREAGAGEVAVFRAGSWGAEPTTLEALATVGIAADSSLNACFAASFPSVTDRRDRLDVHTLCGIKEFPATFFLAAGRRRPAQLCACSFDELRAVLERSHASGHADVVMVTHSFEMVQVGDLDVANRAVRRRRLLGKRFLRLCRFLDDNRDRFDTVHFRSTKAVPDALGRAIEPVRSGWTRTAMRYAEQALSTVY